MAGLRGPPYALRAPHAPLCPSPDHISWKWLPSCEPVLVITALGAHSRCPVNAYCMNQSLWPQGPIPQEVSPTPSLESKPLLFPTSQVWLIQALPQTPRPGGIALEASPALAYNQHGGETRGPCWARSPPEQRSHLGHLPHAGVREAAQHLLSTGDPPGLFEDSKYLILCNRHNESAR